MKKIFFITITFIIFLGCSKKKDRIIYVVNDNLREAILNEYTKIKQDKSSYYIEINIEYDNMNSCFIMSTFQNKESYKTKKIINESNRFLELDNEIYLPIISPLDYLFTKELKGLSLDKEHTIYFYNIEYGEDVDVRKTRRK